MLNESLIAELAAEGVVTETFRRLPPDKKESLYRTSLRLFAEYGFDGVAVDRFCHDAAISKGSFFQYWTSKARLLEMTLLLFDDFLERWVSENRRGDRFGHSRDRLTHLYHAVVINARLHPDERRFYLFATNALPHASIAIEGVDLERHFHTYVAEIIARGEEVGEIRGDFDVELTSQLVSILVRALVNQEYAYRRPSRETGEYLISFLFDGIRA